MYQTTKILTACLLGGLLASCTQQYYRPRPNDPPLLTEKNDLKVAAMFAINASSTLRATAAWSPVKHLGVQAGYGGTGDSRVSPDGANDFYSERRSFGFGGVGYYTALRGNGHFEVYGGLGSARYYGGAFSGYVHRLRMTNWYVQPAVGLRLKNIEFAASLRYDYLSRGLTEVNDSMSSGPEHRFLDYNGYHMLQPGLTMRAGGRLKFMFEFYESFVLNRAYEGVYGSNSQHGVAQYSMGVQWDLSRLLRR